MDTLFENRYVRNKEIIKAMCLYLFFRRKIQIFLQAIMCALFVGALVSLILGYTYNWFALIAVPLYFAYKIYLYFAQVRRMMQRDQEMFGDAAVVESVVTEEGIQTSSSGGAQMTLSFDKFHSVDHTKKLILVYTKAKLIYVLPKDSFTKGSAEACLLFLKSKV